MTDSTRATLTSVTPFFIVQDFAASVAFYRDGLGFRLSFAAPQEGPFFGIVRRDAVQIMLKATLPDVKPQPNHKQHPWAKWDAFIHTENPDSLAAEFESRHIKLHSSISDTEDHLRGFELQDPDGYVLFFGRPT
jgi:catechol 2,3-dioxygenase-like lactoylglutathione lyase family enzyme